MNKYDIYTTFDLPIPYWAKSIPPNLRNDSNCIKVYPIKIRDYYSFNNYVYILSLDKNTNFEFIMMNELEYFMKDGYDGIPYIVFFDRLLHLLLRESKDFLDNENFTAKYLNDKYYSLRNSSNKPLFKINDVVYDNDDYLELREIIAYQNDLELPDFNEDKQFREMMEQAKKDYRRLSGGVIEMGDLEEQIICLNISTNIPYEEIYNMTIRKFSKALRYVDKKLHYQIYMNASMSGFVKFDNKDITKHWMSTLKEKEKYKDLLLDAGEVANKINNVHP